MNNNLNQQKMIDAIVSQSGGKINRNTLNQAVKNKDFRQLISNLSPTDQEKLSAAMSDKEQLRSLLQSNEAKALLKNLLGGENHGRS